jgi:hypothetical protein
MLEMNSKWFTNTLAKKSMLTNDFVQCSDNKRLYVVSYGELTTSGKNTYNVAIKDESDVLIREENNLYLDAITKIILGASPKAKANKETNKSKNTTSLGNEYERLLKRMQESKKAFEDFCTLHDIATLEDAIKKDNEAKDVRRKEAQSKRRNEEAKILRINKLRKWAKDTQRLELLQGLNKQLLEM